MQPQGLKLNTVDQVKVALSQLSPKLDNSQFIFSFLGSAGTTGQQHAQLEMISRM